MIFKHLLRLIFAVLYLHPANGDTGDEESVRMTVVVHQPLGGDRYSCFLSLPDTDASLRYARYVKTRDNDYQYNYHNREPYDAYPISNYPGSRRVRLDTTYDNTFGIFYCRASKPGRLLTTITATVLLENAKIVPTDGLYTKTVNYGDQGVVLGMTGIVASYNNFAWRFNNSDILRRTSTGSYSIGHAITKADAGVYECHYYIERSDARQGLIRLIVRGCPAGRWGPPGCKRVCDKCYNGGICNDRNGRCVCPAGFTGRNCLGACRENKAGHNCEITCSSSSLSCTGQVFCLPDPMGCTCATGFQDYRCNTGCSPGRYGANCLQECHCLQSTSCDRFTGQCTGGGNRCSASWSGDNCQIPDVCDNDYFGETCTQKCQCMNDQPCDRDTGRCVNNQCKPGFSFTTGSLSCQECSGGKYGLNCSETCHCNEVSCDKMTGSCAGGCKSNWAQPDCVTGVKSVSNTKANSGQSSTITCIVTGPTPPTEQRVRLYHVSDTKEYTAESSNVEDQDRIVTFTVPEVQSNDEFRCYISQPYATLSHLADMFELPELTTAPRASKIQALEVTITWDSWSSPPHMGDPPIIQYTIYYREDGSQWQRFSEVPSTRTSETVSNLKPEIRYEFSVAVSREGLGGEGPRSPSVSATTPCSVPLNAPEIVSTKSEDTIPRLITVQWKELEARFHGCSSGIVQYHIRYNSNSGSSTAEYTVNVIMDPAVTSFNITNLEPYTQYGISVGAFNAIGPGPWSEDVLAYSPEETPPPPEKVVLLSSTEDSLTLLIEATKPYNLNGNINQYVIQYQQASGTAVSQNITVYTNSFKLTQTIPGLPGFTDFTIKVKIANGVGESEWSNSVTAKTINKGNRDGSTGSVTSGVVGALVVVVLLLAVLTVFIMWRRKQKPTFKPRQMEKEQHTLPRTDVNDVHIYENTEKAPETPSTAKTDAEKIQVELELDKITVAEKDRIPPKPKHKPLPPPHSDKQLSCSSSQQEEPDEVADFQKLLNFDAEEVQSSGAESASSQLPSSEQSVYGNLNIGPQLSIPIPVDKLEGYIKQKKASSTDSLKYEYSILPVDQKKPWTVAEHPDLKTKNRFKNIIPYDHSRVPLVPIDGVPLSDYYNASYIKNYNHKTSFIAAMGPNASALNDFWRMIWQERINLIVMVTKLVENGKEKCKKYWPSRKDLSEQFGEVVVNLVEQKSLSDYTIHTLKVHKVDCESESRMIKHFTMTSWPDMGVPLYPSSILNLIQVVKETKKSQLDHQGETPVLVHCSAGVGRTGTFIAVYTLLDMMNQQQQISVFGFVNEMRESRVNMVQTYDQYVFIYSALLEAYLCGDTRIPTEEFPEALSKLKRLNPKTRRTHLEDEFRILNRVTPKPDDSFSGALLPENVNKNRFPDVIPLERHRPVLVTEGDDDSNNYINAAFVDSFNRSDAFITTQIPLPHTMADIWRLAFDWNCPAIVTLDDPTSVNKKWEQLWPEGGLTRFGPLLVELISSTEGKVYKCQIFKVSRNDKKDKSIIVKHFQLLVWASNQDKPSSPHCVLDLVDAVQRWKDECHSSRPVIVQCLNGVGRSGVFCAVSIVAEKITSDDEVDIFQAVKRLRMNRPLMVETLEQYVLCYEVILEHLQRFQHYGNLHY